LLFEDAVLDAIEGRGALAHAPDWERREYPEQGESGWLPNIWLGTSIETDRYAFRADHLRKTPAAVRFLSLEPLLGPLPSLDLHGIDWVIVGGESGQGARPMHPDWVRDLRDRCVAAGVPFFFKQWGGRTPKAGGRELDGRTWDEYPSMVPAKLWVGE
jgi:protein gp37